MGWLGGWCWLTGGEGRGGAGRRRVVWASKKVGGWCGLGRRKVVWVR